MFYDVFICNLELQRFPRAELRLEALDFVASVSRCGDMLVPNIAAMCGLRQARALGHPHHGHILNTGKMTPSCIVRRLVPALRLEKRVVWPVIPEVTTHARAT